MKRFSIFLVTIVFVTATNIPAIAQDHEWWDLQPGAWKWFTDALDPAKELNIWVTQGAPGMADFHFDWIQNDAIVDSSILLFSKDPNGDYWWHATDGAFFKEYENHSINNPLLIVDEPLWVGKAWSDTIYNPGVGIDLLYNLECVAETEVVTPSGVYHSFEILYEVYYGPNWSAHFIERKSHCDGVGLVKFILQDYPLNPGINGEYELTDASDVEIPSSPRISINNHPNPFNPQTTISFSLDHGDWVEVGVFDLTGRRITTLASREFTTGSHSLTWNGRDAQGQAMPSGAYIVRMEAGSGVDSKKVMLLR